MLTTHIQVAAQFMMSQKSRRNSKYLAIALVLAALALLTISVAVTIGVSVSVSMESRQSDGLSVLVLILEELHKGDLYVQTTVISSYVP